MTATSTFTEMYEKMKANGGWKLGELVVITGGRQTGKSWFAQQHMTQYFSNVVKFSRLNSDKLKNGDVLCDVTQEIQDWLMKEFDPNTMWQYAAPTMSSINVPWGKERVTMRDEVYTALVLRWS